MNRSIDVMIGDLLCVAEGDEAGAEEAQAVKKQRKRVKSASLLQSKEDGRCRKKRLCMNNLHRAIERFVNFLCESAYVFCSLSQEGYSIYPAEHIGPEVDRPPTREGYYRSSEEWSKDWEVEGKGAVPLVHLLEVCHICSALMLLRIRHLSNYN